MKSYSTVDACQKSQECGKHREVTTGESFIIQVFKGQTYFGIWSIHFSTMGENNQCSISSKTSTRNAQEFVRIDEAPTQLDDDPEQVRRTKICRRLWLSCKYFKKTLQSPTNNNLENSSNTTEQDVDTTPSTDDNQSGTALTARNLVIYVRRQKPKRVRDSTFNKEKMLLVLMQTQALEREIVKQDNPDSQATKSVATTIRKSCSESYTVPRIPILSWFHRPHTALADCTTHPIHVVSDAPKHMRAMYHCVEGLNHNLFSVGPFCDADLEVAFQKSTCFVRDLQGNDLLTGNRGTDLYTISLQEITSSTPLCHMAKASPTQAWLWHRRLSHLNFDYINLLSKKDVVIGLPKLKYVKDQLCSSCETLFLRSKDETPEDLKDFLTMIQRNLQAPVISVRTDRGTEFLNKTLNAFFKEEGIEHQTSTPRTPEQNGIVERRNRTLVEAARTMLSASKLPLFFWAEAIATACYTQNRSIIIPTHEKTAYHIINDRKPSIKHLHIFGCTCYLTRDGENLDKMKEKGDPCILVGYSTQSKGYRVYNKRTRLIVESIHLRFDEIKEMSETSVANDTSGLVPQRQKASDYDNPDPAPELQNVSPSADTTVPSQQELDLLFGPLYDEFFNDGTSRVNKSSSPTDNSAPQDTHPSTNIHPTSEPTTQTNVHAEENNDNQAEFTNPFCTPVQENAESSSRNIGNSNVHTFNQPQDSEYRWTKDHPLTQVRGNPSKPVQTRRQLATDPKMCMFALTVSIVEPKNIKEAMADSAWIEAMQEELHQFDRLQVWELVDKPLAKGT
ncbi:retrovirus-related pol polyprotein from transposon TNT 1-94 [Tanacetum coccineum]